MLAHPVLATHWFSASRYRALLRVSVAGPVHQGTRATESTVPHCVLFLVHMEWNALAIILAGENARVL